MRNVTRAFHELLTHTAQRTPTQIALIYRNKSVTFQELYAKSEALAAALVEQGLSRGNRVAVHFEKSVDEVVSLLAVSIAGGIVVNINSLLKGPQILHILNDSGAQFLMTTSSRLNGLSAELANLSTLQVVFTSGNKKDKDRSWSFRHISIEGAIESYRWIREPVPLVDSDPAAIIYTSGSTGKPKGVVVSHRNLVSGAEIVAAYLKNGASDRVLSVLPFSFDYGLNQLTTSLLVGATLVLVNYLTPIDIIKTSATAKITGLAGIPTIWSQLLQYNWNQESFPDLRYLTNSGGHFPVALLKEYRRRLPKVEIYLMYGLTEAFRSTYLDPSQIDIRPESIGKAIPNAEVLILDNNGRPCPPGQVGQLVHRGVQVSLGYWNDPEATRERFGLNPLQPPEISQQETVVFSGDLARQDEEGYIYYVGRSDEMIKTSGFRVSPTEVEEYFYLTGLVQDAVAVGVPDSILGQSIKVALSLRVGKSILADELRTLATAGMPSYMVPQEISIVDSLPRNSHGKIDRAAIRQQILNSCGNDSDRSAQTSTEQSLRF